MLRQVVATGNVQILASSATASHKKTSGRIGILPLVGEFSIVSEPKLSDQRQHVLRVLVGQRQHVGTGLNQDLSPRQFG